MRVVVVVLVGGSGEVVAVFVKGPAVVGAGLVASCSLGWERRSRGWRDVVLWLWWYVG